MHFDWLQGYSSTSNGSPVARLVQEEVEYEAKILVVGCGSSRLPLDLYGDGYENITCIDWSTTAIALQKELNEQAAPIVFRTMDARDLSQFKAGSFDVVIDKAMLDAVITGDAAGETTTQILSEIHRVLTPTGKFICVSHGTLKQRKQFLKQHGKFLWRITKLQI